MASMVFMVTTVFIICWFWIQVTAKGEFLERNMTLTWNESRKHCESIGKVLFDVKKNMSMSILKNIINETIQAWVSGTVELSEFITMSVCRETTGLQSNKNKTFDTDIISNCLTFCKDYRYIGLKETDCVCIKDDTNLKKKNECNIGCSNDPIHQCGGKESISLYEKVDSNITRQIAAGFKECVYALKNDNATKLFTESCVGGMADGGMCDSVDASDCASNILKPAGSHLCRMDLNSSYRWTQVKMFCAGIGGQLMSPSELPLNMEEKRKYWLGIHRVVTIHEAKEQMFIRNDTYCAVARKEGYTLMIEGEDCEAKHAILCQDKDILEQTASSINESTETPGQGSNADGTIIYVVVAGSAILLFAIVIIALACVFRRRNISQHRVVSTNNSSSEHNVLLQKQNTIPPAKPSRKAHSKKEHVQISYENIALVHSEQDVEMHQPGHSNSGEENYDKIELDKGRRETNDNKEDGLHTYHHTFLRKTEDQYDLTDLSRDKTPFPSVTYDTRPLTQAINSVNGEDCKVNLETYKEADNDMYTTMGPN
ncbi:hypothetical protein CHS0354_030998 [Potamilus streckersoni]|uniref:WSC domain-containing protein n=1 Tax=Potamilus streckersoni TaxID=2493646 RepID=A0AAE0S359_9BIVA|nr:hypothetical protein CHS0354_030998 [Potamilus streckersoni]